MTLHLTEEAARQAFPATVTAHWSTGPVPCCEPHAMALRKLGAFLGLHVAVTMGAPEGAQCENCKNEFAAMKEPTP
jgi:hypothetical protein